MTKEQKKATRKALRQYAEGPVRAAWAEVIEGVLRHYEAVEPLCAQLLRLRYPGRQDGGRGGARAVCEPQHLLPQGAGSAIDGSGGSGEAGAAIAEMFQVFLFAVLW